MAFAALLCTSCQLLFDPPELQGAGAVHEGELPAGSLHESLVGWSEATTWNDFGEVEGRLARSKTTAGSWFRQTMIRSGWPAGRAAARDRLEVTWSR